MSECSVPKQLKILTLNVRNFPCCGCGTNGNLSRILEICRSGDYDVLCFQEVWSWYARYLLGRERQHYTDSFITPWKFGFNSGLAILTRHPIVESDLVTYSSYAGDENLVRKGAQWVRIRVDDEYTDIYNTHLQAGGTSKSVLRWVDRLRREEHSAEDIKFLQINALINFIQKTHYTRQASGYLCGDFNLTPEYHIDAYIRGASSTHGQPIHCTDIFSPSMSALQGSSRDRKKRIDYIFALQEQTPQPIAVITDKFGNLTDHAAVIKFRSLGEPV